MSMTKKLMGVRLVGTAEGRKLLAKPSLIALERLNANYPGIIRRISAWRIGVMPPEIPGRGLCDYKNKMILVRDARPAVIAHEVIHAIGGNEKLCELVENSLFTQKEGATNPTQGDYVSRDWDITKGDFERYRAAYQNYVLDL